MYVGGPVQPSAIVCLAEFLDPSPAGLLVLGRIGFPAPDAGIEELTEATARRRVFAGYAGWSEGQLDEEVADGDWIAHAAIPDDVFTDVPAGPVEHGPEPHGRRLRPARAHALRPERELTTLSDQRDGYPLQAAPVSPPRRLPPENRHAEARPLVDNPSQVRRHRLDRAADRP